MNIKRVFNSHGFTLIEAIVAISILGVVGYILADVLARGFRGSVKSQLIGKIKQNGQVSMNILDQTIRRSDIIICPVFTGVSSQVLVVQDKNGKYIRFALKPETSPNPASNGYITTDDPVAALPAGTFDPTRAADFCDPLQNYYAPLPNPSTPGTVFLTNYDIKDGVSVRGITSGFTRIAPTPGVKDAVLIQFNLGPAIQSGNDYATRTQADVQLSTTVEIR